MYARWDSTRMGEVIMLEVAGGKNAFEKDWFGVGYFAAIWKQASCLSHDFWFLYGAAESLKTTNQTPLKKYIPEVGEVKWSEVKQKLPYHTRFKTLNLLWATELLDQARAKWSR